LDPTMKHYKVNINITTFSSTPTCSEFEEEMNLVN